MFHVQVCIVFGQPSSWNGAMRILLAPDFFDVAMALTPEMINTERRATLRKLFKQQKLVRTATLTGNHVIYLLARWIAAMVGMLGRTAPPERRASDKHHHGARSVASSVVSAASSFVGGAPSVRVSRAVGTFTLVDWTAAAAADEVLTRHCTRGTELNCWLLALALAHNPPIPMTSFCCKWAPSKAAATPTA